jgi:hypothetical protein
MWFGVWSQPGLYFYRELIFAISIFSSHTSYNTKIKFKITPPKGGCIFSRNTVTARSKTVDQ